MSQNQPYPSVKPEPHSTDVFADHGPLFSEAEMTDMTERAWAIKKAREQEKWHLGDIRPKGPQTNKAAIGDTARSNATSRRSLLGSLYGLDLKARKLSQNLSANRDSKNNVYVKYEVGNKTSGGSESFAFGLGTLSTNFSRTQGPGSEGYRHTSQPEILTHEDMVLRLRELAYELGYGIFPLKAQHELGTPSVAPFSLFPSPSSQLPPPLPDCPFHWPPPAPIPLQPDISAPSNA
ncbi:hypothetical protein FRC09_020339 [Ceratobasidium sp. 395]|nr:hypothetical protein FRC09_020339 [Ceratobasidium sp. 395]